MAKPEYQLERLAVQLLDVFDTTRQQLLDEITTLQQVDTGPDLSTFPVYRSVLDGDFLSVDIAQNCREAFSARQYRNIHGDIEALRCVGAVRQVSADLVAYFLKYRYIDLTDFVPAASGSEYRETSRTWSLPEGYRQLDTATGSPAEDMIVNRVRSAPWLGALDKELIREAISWLLAIGFLEFSQDTEIRANDAPADGIGVLRIRKEFVAGDPAVRVEYDALLVSSRIAEDIRRGLVTDLGVGIGAVGAYETYQLVRSASHNDTVRISTYHLRTVVAGRSLTQWLREKPGVRVDIMCLGPTSISGLTEGADPESLLTSLAHGIQSFQDVRDELPKKQRNQIRIRIYGDIESESFFRGAILTGAKGTDPKRILATTWRFGEYRANYGEILKLEGDSNIARLIVDYYERAWRNAIPVTFSRKRDWMAWLFRSLTLEDLTTITVGTAAGSIFFINSAYKVDSLLALLGTVPILIATVARTLRQVLRALALKRSMQEHT